MGPNPELTILCIWVWTQGLIFLIVGSDPQLTIWCLWVWVVGLYPELIYFKSMGLNPEINFSYCGFKPRFHYFKFLGLDSKIIFSSCGFKFKVFVFIKHKEIHWKLSDLNFREKSVQCWHPGKVHVNVTQRSSYYTYIYL